MPKLQRDLGVVGFIREHLGKPVASTAVLAERTEAFYAQIKAFAARNAVAVVEFKPGQRKDDVMREQLAAFLAAGRAEGVVFIGRAQEKVSVWATTRRRDAEGKSCPWIVRESRVVTHWYFYCYDACAGPFFLKYCGYFPYNAKLCLNGNEYAKAMAARAGIGFTPLDNGFAAVDDVEAVQAICDSFDEQVIWELAGKTQPETVTTVLVRHDTDLYDLRVKAGSRTEVIHTTRDHLIWDVTLGYWVKAADFHNGDRLLSPSGAVALAGSGDAPHASGWMWHITVMPGHVFYVVVAVGVGVLVHNEDPNASQVPNLTGMSQTQADKVLYEYGFELKSISGSGAYATYQAPDGSKVTIRLSDGRVTRTSVVDPGPNKPNYPQRWDQNGNPTDSHDTGENLNCS